MSVKRQVVPVSPAHSLRVLQLPDTAPDNDVPEHVDVNILGIRYRLTVWSARAWALAKVKPAGVLPMSGGGFIHFEADRSSIPKI